jgi:hypothetical protein
MARWPEDLVELRISLGRRECLRAGLNLSGAAHRQRLKRRQTVVILEGAPLPVSDLNNFMPSVTSYFSERCDTTHPARPQFDARLCYL